MLYRTQRVAIIPQDAWTTVRITGIPVKSLSLSSTSLSPSLSLSIFLPLPYEQNYMSPLLIVHEKTTLNLCTIREIDSRSTYWKAIKLFVEKIADAIRQITNVNGEQGEIVVAGLCRNREKR